jgi:hypothetical protein
MILLREQIETMPSTICRVITPVPRHLWHDLYRADVTSLPDQSPEWLEFVCAAGNYIDASRLYELDNGKRLILPLVRQRGVPTPIAMAASFPYAWGIGGVITADTLEAEDLAVVYEDLAKLGYLQVSLRPNPLQGEIWTRAGSANVVKVPRLAHVIDLAGGFDEVWASRFCGRTRNYVRQAERAGVEVECDTTGRLVPVFYELFEKSLVRWAGQQHEPVWLARWRGRRRDSLHKLQMMAEMMGERCRVWIAWSEGKPAAASIVLQDVNAHYILGAMDKAVAGPLHVNEYIHRLAIEDACNSNCRYYDMGETGESQTLARFKSRFGAVGYPYADYNLERFPVTRLDGMVRGLVKRFIGFKDA